MLKELKLPQGIKIKRTGHVRNGYAWDIIWPSEKIIPIIILLEGSNINLSDSKATIEYMKIFDSSNSLYYEPIPGEFPGKICNNQSIE